MRIAVSFLFVLSVGCSAPQTAGEVPPSSNSTALSVSDTIQLADNIYNTSRKRTRLRQARDTLRAAIDTHGAPYALLWRLGRNNVHLVLHDEANGALWAEEGRIASERAAQQEPNRVEGALYEGICASLLAKHRPSDSQALLAVALKQAKRAIAIAPNYDNGAAHRLLGGLLIYAPEWPTSVGDVEEGIEVLEALLSRHTNEPIGTFLLAEAYRKVDQTNDAKRLYKKVLSFSPKGLWRLEGPPYRKRARQVLNDLQRVP